MLEEAVPSCEAFHTRCFFFFSSFVEALRGGVLPCSRRGHGPLEAGATRVGPGSSPDSADDLCLQASLIGQVTSGFCFHFTSQCNWVINLPGA